MKNCGPRTASTFRQWKWTVPEAFYRRADNVAALDAPSGNFLNSGGVVVPTDVICLPASPQMVEALGF